MCAAVCCVQEELQGDLCNPRDGTTPPDLTALANELRSQLDLSKLVSAMPSSAVLQWCVCMRQCVHVC